LVLACIGNDNFKSGLLGFENGVLVSVPGSSSGYLMYRLCTDLYNTSLRHYDKEFCVRQNDFLIHIQAEEMIDYIKHAFKNNMYKLDWMNEETTKVAFEKVK